MFKRLKGSIGKIDEPKSSNTVPQVSLIFEMQKQNVCFDVVIKKTF